QAAGLAYDPGPASLAVLPRAQALVDRAQEPHHGARCRRWPRPVLWPQRHPEEELPVGVFLTHYPAESRNPARRLARSARRRTDPAWRILQSRLSLSALFRRAARRAISLFTQTQPTPAEHPDLPGAG